jgi:hypothetical protein
MTRKQAQVAASRIEIASTELVKNNTVFMTRLTNGVVGFGKTDSESRHEAYRRAAIKLMSAVNTGRIAMLTGEQMKALDRAVRR